MRKATLAIWAGLAVSTATFPAKGQISAALGPWLCPLSQIGAACDAGPSGTGTCIPATCEQTVHAVDDAGNYVLDDAGRDAGIWPIASQKCGACLAFDSPSPDSLWGYCSNVCTQCAQGAGTCFDAGINGMGVGSPSNPDQFLILYAVTYCRPLDAGLNFCSIPASDPGSAPDAGSAPAASSAPDDAAVMSAPESIMDAAANTDSTLDSGLASTWNAPSQLSASDATSDAVNEIVGHGPLGCDVAPPGHSPYFVPLFGVSLALIGLGRHRAGRRA